jgi:hypothetical protein
MAEDVGLREVVVFDIISLDMYKSFMMNKPSNKRHKKDSPFLRFEKTNLKYLHWSMIRSKVTCTGDVGIMMITTEVGDENTIRISDSQTRFESMTPNNLPSNAITNLLLLK